MSLIDPDDLEPGVCPRCHKYIGGRHALKCFQCGDEIAKEVNRDFQENFGMYLKQAIGNSAPGPMDAGLSQLADALITQQNQLEGTQWQTQTHVLTLLTQKSMKKITILERVEIFLKRLWKGVFGTQ